MSRHSKPPTRVNPWSRLLIAACAAFILTVLLMVSAAFNRQAAYLSQFFDRQGMVVLGIEVGTILVLASIALAVERRETRRRIEDREKSLMQIAEQDTTEFSP